MEKEEVTTKSGELYFEAQYLLNKGSEVLTLMRAKHEKDLGEITKLKLVDWWEDRMIELNKEAAVQGGWHQSAYPERVIELIDEYVPVENLTTDEAHDVMKSLKTELSGMLSYS